MTSKASATPDPQTGGTDNVALLIDLLKLATFIAGPMRDGVAEPLALSSNDLRVILALGGEGELAGHDLSEIMGVPPMNVSRALASLLERGLVELGSDPANRRRKPFRLSAQGRATFASTLPALEKVGGALFVDLDKAERVAFGRAMQAVLARIPGWMDRHSPA